MIVHGIFDVYPLLLLLLYCCCSYYFFIVIIILITDLSLLVALAKHDHCGDLILPDHPPELFRSIDTHRPC